MSNPQYYKSEVRDVNFGDRVKIVEPVNIYECKIGNDCFIGPFVEVQRSVVLGSRTKIQSHTFLCELVTIGDDCFVGHGVMFINDTFATGGPAKGNKNLWQNTTIGNRVSIGSNATIMPVKITDDVVVGAGSVVLRDILEPGIYAGNPAKKIRDHIKK